MSLKIGNALLSRQFWLKPIGRFQVYQKLAIASCLGLTLWGCGVTEGQTPPPLTSPPQDQAFPPPAPPDRALTEAEADEIMTAIVRGMNQENAEALLPYLLERDRNEANVEAAFADYKTYFQGQEIARFEREKVERLGKTGEGYPISRFHYRIYSTEGISKPIQLYQEGSIRAVDEFFNYSYWAKNLLDRYVAAIQSGDAEALSRILNPEDLPFPKEKSENAIAKYAAKFDPKTLDYQFQGLAETGRGFTYAIEGEKNGTPVEHIITLIYGDGVVGIEDPFVK